MKAVRGKPETYGPIKEVVFIIKRTGLIEEITGTILYERTTVNLAQRAAESALKWYTQHKERGDLAQLAPSVEWTVHHTTDEATAG